MNTKTTLYFLLLLAPCNLSATRIHIFDDSHASFGFSNERGSVPKNERSFYNHETRVESKLIEFIINWLGTKTIFSIARDGLFALDLKKKNLCVQNTIDFLDIYSFYSNPDGSLDGAKSDNLVHVNTENNNYIKNKLIELLIDKYQLF